MSFRTPTRHGNWQVINGELVDVNLLPAPPPVVAPAPKPSVPSHAPRKRKPKAKR